MDNNESAGAIRSTRRLEIGYWLLVSGGLFVTGMLVVAHVQKAGMPCLAQFKCDEVTRSVYGSVLGIPLSWIGFVGYLVFAALGATRMFSASAAVRAKAFSVTWALLAGSAALCLWLIGVTVFVMQNFCLWCYINAIVIVLLLLWCAFASGVVAKERFPNRAVFILPVVALILVGVWMPFLNKLPQLVDEARVAAATKSELAPPSAHRLGDPNAENTVVVFSDLQCSACAASFASLEPEIAAKKGWSLVFRHYPLATHKLAFSAAVGAEMAKSEKQFWKFVELSYDHPIETSDDLSYVVREAHLSTENRLDEQEAARDKVNGDKRMAERLGIHGTPVLILIHGNDTPRVINPTDLLKKLNPANQTPR